MRLGLIIILIFLSSCATYNPVSNYKEQLNSIYNEAEQKKKYFKVRRAEIKQAYESEEINKSEYLLLKNNLDSEISNYFNNIQQRTNMLELKARYEIQSQ